MCKSCKNWVTVLAKFCQGCFKVYQSWLNFLGCAPIKNIWLWTYSASNLTLSECIRVYVHIWLQIYPNLNCTWEKIWMANPSFNPMCSAWVNAALPTWVLSRKIERKYIKGLSRCFFFMFHHFVTSRTSKCDISLSLGEKITASCFLGVLIRKVPQIYEIRFFYAGHFTPKKDEAVIFPRGTFWVVTSRAA